jgi:hypothetical protein
MVVVLTGCGATTTATPPPPVAPPLTVTKTTEIVEEEVSILPEDDAAAVKKVIRGKFPQLRACFDKSSQTTKTLEVAFQIGTDGSVGIPLPEPVKDPFEVCVHDVIKKSAFPPPSMGYVNAYYQLKFTRPE